MRPSEISASLRTVASKLGLAGSRPCRSAVSHELRSVLAVMEQYVTGDAPGGPWAPSSVQGVAERGTGMLVKNYGVPPGVAGPDEVFSWISQQMNSEDGIDSDEAEYYDPANGTMFFFQKGGRTFGVFDVFGIHAGDAHNSFQVAEVGPDGFLSDSGPDESGNDIAALLAAV